MKTSLDHLPENKQHELEQVVKITCEQVAAEFIILFGSYARNDWVEELAQDGHHYQYQSDYDILVLVADKKVARKAYIWQRLWNETRRGINTPITFISHSVKYFNSKVEHAEYFFTDILKEGILLYDSKKFELAKPRELNLEERKLKAVEDFDYWFESAKEFFSYFQTGFKKGLYKSAAFQLHQATEHCYAAILLVFINYKPRTHDLHDLSKQITAQEPEFLRIFPKGTSEENRLFELLRNAYVGGRYQKEYEITKEELEWLSERVLKLHDLAEEICKKKIESFTKEANET